MAKSAYRANGLTGGSNVYAAIFVADVQGGDGPVVPEAVLGDPNGPQSGPIGQGTVIDIAPRGSLTVDYWNNNLPVFGGVQDLTFGFHYKDKAYTNSQCSWVEGCSNNVCEGSQGPGIGCGRQCVACTFQCA